MAAPVQNLNFNNFLRRRSTHIYQSIFVEPDTINENESKNHADWEEKNHISLPVHGPWKIFVLTTSMTNYFCCGCNLTTVISRLKNYSATTPITWAVEKLGGQEIAGIKKKFASSLMDWILDSGTTLSHLLNSAWVEAALTYLIVLVCGLVSTIGFLRFPDIRSVMHIKAKEIHFVWIILLYIPTFFSVVCGRLWLSVALEYQFLTTKSHPGERLTDLKELATKFEEWTLKALWLETVLEAKPQAVLQSMFLIERIATSMTNSIVLDCLPILLTLWSIYSVTNSIYDFVVLNFVDQTGMYAKLYGNTYSAVSTLAPGLLISVMRSMASSQLEEFIITLSSLTIYYIVFEIIYQLTYAFCCLISTEANKQGTFVKLYTAVLVLIFSSCVTIWGLFSSTTILLKIYIVISMFVLFLIANLFCCFKAFEFVEECFRLKNVKIDEAWSKFKSTS